MIGHCLCLRCSSRAFSSHHVGGQMIQIFKEHFYKIIIISVALLIGFQFAANLLYYKRPTFLFFSYGSGDIYETSSLRRTNHGNRTQALEEIRRGKFLPSSRILGYTAIPLQRPGRTSQISITQSVSHIAGSPAVPMTDSRVVLALNTTTSAASQTTTLKSATQHFTTQNTTKTVASSTAYRTLAQRLVSSTASSETSSGLCPMIPPNLVGRIPVNMNPDTLDNVAARHPELWPGGQWHPAKCKARHRVAIVMPYRDREAQLTIFVRHIHPFLEKQQLDYGLYVIEQTTSSKFNRAMLLNIGFVEARKDREYQCFVFHDVDLLPEDDRNIYSCPDQPRHLSVAIDKFNYRLPYATIFGGASIITTEQFLKVNGFSNWFFGWGGEDDDMYDRVRDGGYRISRYPTDIARYSMIRHINEKGNAPNPQRWNLLRTGKKRFKTDGLNSLVYKVLATTKTSLFTKVTVDIDMQEVLRRGS